MWTRQTPFAPPGSKLDLEAGRAFTPRFDASGLIPVIAQDAENGEVLMLAYMNAEALARTIQTGEAWYWSRSRAAFWRKGETSGHTQSVVSISTDCDQDAILLKVRQIGPACHTNRRSCFYRTVELNEGSGVSLLFTDASSR
ncbi:MAG: phosphoribosyl-AMP cyclohydrolase [Proteobacteria bacterium]|nr:phosphoribosyl-AMP cyclohydrolase [Pseudomonadota bacterium]